MNKYLKYFLIVTYLFMTMLMVYMVKMLFFDTHSTENTYAIERTKSFPHEVVEISKTYKAFDNIQLVPIKGYNRIGLKYLCGIELIDSTFLVYYTDNFVHKFHYEGLIYHNWEVISAVTDSSSTVIDKLKCIVEVTKNNEKYFYNTETKSYKHLNKLTGDLEPAEITKELPDTIEYLGVLVYDLEKYTSERYVENFDTIRTTQRYDENLNIKQ